MDLGVKHDSSSLNKMSQNGSHALSSPAHMFVTFFRDLFHIIDEHRGSEDPPENILSGLAFHTNQENLNQMALLQSLTALCNFSG